MCQVEELGAFLRERSVQPSATDQGTPPETVADINVRLLAAMQSCMEALNLGGLKLQSLIDAVETRCVACMACASGCCKLRTGPSCPILLQHHTDTIMKR